MWCAAYAWRMQTHARGMMHVHHLRLTPHAHTPRPSTPHPHLHRLTPPAPTGLCDAHKQRAHRL
ncbi:hypothetical protein OAO87_02545 [bacterium]|nr:hypothetical protein [bacterium]